MLRRWAGAADEDGAGGAGARFGEEAGMGVPAGKQQCLTPSLSFRYGDFL